VRQKKSHRMLAFVVFIFVFITGCGSSSPSNKLIGKWEHREPDSGIVVVLEFTKDKLSFSSVGVTSAKTSYLYIDEDTIKVRNPDTGAEVDTFYSIDGDRLMIDFSGEEKIEYTRVK